MGSYKFKESGVGKMRKQMLVVFNEMLYGTNAVFTSPVYDDILGRYDKTAIQYVATDVSGTAPTLTVTIEGSNDRRNWLLMTTNGGPINAKNLTAGTTNTDWGQTTTPDAPYLSYARLKIVLGGASPAARLKISVTCRDDA
ncbi:MAG: hypothetical protein WC931_04210 [Bacilli bacterium]|jgi:hypothetical protein